MSLRVKDLLAYQDKLEIAVEKGSSDIFFNDSILHAMVIMRGIFIKATQESKRNVCMYYGNFSLFRDRTQGKILGEKMACLIDDLPEVDQQRWEQTDYFGNLRHSLQDFLNSEGSLKLIMEYGVDTLKDDSVWEILQPSIINGRTEIYVLKTNMGLDRFAVTSEAYRVENSDGLKTATCCFGDKKNANVLNDNFRELLELSQPVLV
ncbi:MAG: hypothetical protein LUE99_12750 [Bacteroides sp.]|nr:hypothetical protein [Bacteroides sp.]